MLKARVAKFSVRQHSDCPNFAPKMAKTKKYEVHIGCIFKNFYCILSFGSVKKMKNTLQIKHISLDIDILIFDNALFTAVIL